MANNIDYSASLKFAQFLADEQIEEYQDIREWKTEVKHHKENFEKIKVELSLLKEVKEKMTSITQTQYRAALKVFGKDLTEKIIGKNIVIVDDSSYKGDKPSLFKLTKSGTKYVITPDIKLNIAESPAASGAKHFYNNDVKPTSFQDALFSTNGKAKK